MTSQSFVNHSKASVSCNPREIMAIIMCMHGGVDSLCCKWMNSLSCLKVLLHICGVQNVKLRNICFEVVFALDFDSWSSCFFHARVRLFPGPGGL